MADENLPPVLAAALTQVRRLAADRATLVKALAEVDAKIAKVAEVLGVDATAFTDAGGPPAGGDRKPQGRSRSGTMTESVMTALATADGLSRADLIYRLAASEFADQQKNNPNTFYNIVSRGLKRGEIIERDRRLYHASRPPTDETAEGGPISLFPAIPRGSNG